MTLIASHASNGVLLGAIRAVLAPIASYASYAGGLRAVRVPSTLIASHRSKGRAIRALRPDSTLIASYRSKALEMRGIRDDSSRIHLAVSGRPTTLPTSCKLPRCSTETRTRASRPLQIRPMRARTPRIASYAATFEPIRTIRARIALIPPMMTASR